IGQRRLPPYTSPDATDPVGVNATVDHERPRVAGRADAGDMTEVAAKYLVREGDLPHRRGPRARTRADNREETPEALVVSDRSSNSAASCDVHCPRNRAWYC